MPEISPAKVDRVSSSSSSSSSSSGRASVKIEEIEGGGGVVNGSEELESKPETAVSSIADNAVAESSGGIVLSSFSAQLKRDGRIRLIQL